MTGCFRQFAAVIVSALAPRGGASSASQAAKTHRRGMSGSSRHLTIILPEHVCLLAQDSEIDMSGQRLSADNFQRRCHEPLAAQQRSKKSLQKKCGIRI